MSVAYERPPEWELPARPGSARSARVHEVGADDVTVVPFPTRHTAHESRPVELPVDRPDEGLAASMVPVAAPPELWPALPELGAASAGSAGQVTEQIAVRPGRSRERVVATPRRGPRPCPASAPESLPAPGLRLTARGRRVVGVLATTCVLGLLAVGAWLVTAQFTAPVVPDSAPSVVVVHSGDSLWSIAHDIAPHSDPRKVVAALQERNHLGSPVVRVGQALEVPK